jgi:hypothetical protein
MSQANVALPADRKAGFIMKTMSLVGIRCKEQVLLGSLYKGLAIPS